MLLTNINSILKKISENHKSDIKMNANSRILTVDMLNLFIRAYSANPSVNDNGVHIGGVVGSLLSLGYTIKRFRPTRVIIVTDGVNSIKKRKEIFPDYKAQRPLQKKNKVYNKKFHYSTAEMQEKIMKMEIKRLVEYFSFIPLSSVSIQNLEADDVIWYITTQLFPAESTNHIIMSSDKDFLQLCSNENIKVYSPTKKTLYDNSNVDKIFGVPSQNISLFRAIDGDKSDNIPGVKMWGKKTILKKLPILADPTQDVNLDILYKYICDNIIEVLKENFDSIIKRNHKLMSLGEIEMQDYEKEKIRDAVLNMETTILSKFEIKKMLIEDCATSSIKNLDSWLDDCFQRLDYFAHEFNKNLVIKRKDKWQQGT